MLRTNADDVAATGLIIILLLAPLAALLSAFVLGSYRRAVLRAMLQSADGSVAPSPPLQTSVDGPRFEVLKRAPLKLSAEAESLYRRVRRSPRRAAAAYALAGLSYAMVAALVFMLGASASFTLGLAFALFLSLTWPVVQTSASVLTDERTGIWLLIPLWVLVVALTMPDAKELGDTFNKTVGVTLTILFASVMCLLLVTNRVLRSTAPYVLLVLSAAFLAARLVNGPVLWAAAGTAGLGAGLLLLRGVARAYEAKKTSDQMMAVRVVWVIIGLVAVPSALASIGALGLLLILANCTYELVLRWRLRKLRDASRRELPTRLLLLRTFGSKVIEHLSEKLDVYWRHVGSIQLIAGADLASQTLEPHELLSFLSGRLAQRFIRRPEDVEQQVAAMDREPDPDGRFRVHEFFCAADTWRLVLQSLVRESDVVLMDLRGFSRQHQGCSYELGQLVDLVPIERVVLLVNSALEAAFVQAELTRAWQLRAPSSPNQGETAGPVRILNLDDKPRKSTKLILRLLCAAAAGHPPKIPVSEAVNSIERAVIAPTGV